MRLIDASGNNLGIVNIEAARASAAKQDLDLVELAPNTEPPVCRLMNYGKFRFELRKKVQQAKKRQKRTQVKEIKFRPVTEEMDYQTKLRSLTRFLADGDKTKVVLRFRGREMAHRDIGLGVLERVRNDLSEKAVVEQPPRAEGRQMVMVLAPRRATG